MGDQLDVGLRQLYDDRPLLHRVVRCIQLDQGLDYPGALDQLHQASDSARSNGEPTLRGVFKWAGDPAYLAQVASLLERRDAAVSAAYQGAAGPVMLEQDTDQLGRVLLDQDGAPKAAALPATDIGEALTNPAEKERRLARARKLDGAYRGDDGRQRFLEQDRLHLEAGADLLRTLELQAEQQAAHQAAAEVAAKVDKAIGTAGDKRQRLKQLEAEVSKLGPAGAGVRDAAEDELRSELAGADAEPLRLLDQLEGDQPVAAGPSDGTLPPAQQLTILDIYHKALSDKITKLTMQRRLLLDQTGDDDVDLDTLLEEFHKARKTISERRAVVSGMVALSSAEPSPEPAALDAPPGVHPGSHQLDQRIRARMRELDRPESEYAKTFDEIMREDG